MPDPAKCRGCGAEIRWIKTQAGKNTCIDAKPKKMWAYFEKGGWMMIDCYVPHHATCPNVEDFKKKPDPPAPEKKMCHYHSDREATWRLGNKSGHEFAMGLCDECMLERSEKQEMAVFIPIKGEGQDGEEKEDDEGSVR